MSQLAYVKLSMLHIWTDNPRTGSVEDENKEIIALIEKQQNKQNNKLIALARSIINSNGIYDPIGILKYNDSFMVVKEGNRRVTCLKLIKNPKLIPDKYSKLRTTFEKLKTQVNSNIYNNIPARIFNEDENEYLEQWIELRHNGVKDGKGLDTWGGREKENWNKYRGRNTPLLDFHEYLISQNILAYDQINSVSKTNWERILGVIGRKYLGITYEDKKFNVIVPIEEFKKRITKTIEKLSGKSVGIVYDKEAIEKFFYGINFNEVDNLKHNNDSNQENNYPNNDYIKNYKNQNVEEEFGATGNEDLNIKKQKEQSNNSEADKSNIKENDDNKKIRRSTKPAPLLSNIICDLKSSQDTDGIIRLTIEIRNMSKNGDYKLYPIAATMIMRSLLEQCLIYYLKKRNKWAKFFKSKRNDPTLTEIINKYRSDTDIFQQDNSLMRYFTVLYDTPGLKEYFNLIVHHPHKFAATPDALDAIAQNGYLTLVQHLIDYPIK